MANKTGKSGNSYDAEAEARAARNAERQRKIAILRGEISSLENKKQKYITVMNDAMNIVSHIEEFITNLKRTSQAFSEIILSGEAFDKGDFDNETTIFNGYKDNFNEIVLVCNKKINEIDLKIQEKQQEIATLEAQME